MPPILDTKFITAPTKRLVKALSSSDMKMTLNNVNNWQKEDGTSQPLTVNDFGDTHYVVLRDKNNTRLEIIEIDVNTINNPEIDILRRGLKFTGEITEDPDLKQSWTVADTLVELGTHVPTALELLLRGSKENLFYILPKFLKNDGVTPAEPTQDAQAVNKHYLDLQIAQVVNLIGNYVPINGDMTVNGKKTFDQAPISPDATNLNEVVNLGQLQSAIFQGALPASEVVLGLTKFATENEFLNGDDFDGAGKPLVIRPSQAQNLGVSWTPVKNYLIDDIVNYQGILYRALTNNKNKVPLVFNYDLDEYYNTALRETLLSLDPILSVSSNYQTWHDAGYMLAVTSETNLSLVKYVLDKRGVPQSVDSTQNVNLDTLLGNNVDTGASGAMALLNKDGTILYLFNVSSGGGLDDRAQFALSTPFDLSTLSLVKRVSTTYSGQPSLIQGSRALRLIDDKYFLGRNNNSEIILFEIENEDIEQLRSHSKNTTFYNSSNVYEISQDGTKFYQFNTGNKNIEQYDFKTPFDVGHKEEMTPTKIFNIGLQVSTGYIAGLRFSKDGLHMYAVLGAVAGTVFEYTLSTPWDISTASFTGHSYNLNAQGNNIFNIDISEDGTKFFAALTTNLHVYTLSTPWDISTISYIGAQTLPVAILAGSNSLRFLDGGKKFVYQKSGGIVYETLSTAYDYSTKTTVENESVSLNNITPLFVSDDGGIMIGGFRRNDMVTTGNYEISTAELSTPYKPSTISLKTSGISGYSPTRTGNPIFLDNGKKVLMAGINNYQANYSRIYTLATPYDIYGAKSSEDFVNLTGYSSSGTATEYIKVFPLKQGILNTAEAGNTNFLYFDFEKRYGDWEKIVNNSRDYDVGNKGVAKSSGFLYGYVKNILGEVKVAITRKNGSTFDYFINAYGTSSMDSWSSRYGTFCIPLSEGDFWEFLVGTTATNATLSRFMELGA